MAATVRCAPALACLLDFSVAGWGDGAAGTRPAPPPPKLTNGQAGRARALARTDKRISDEKNRCSIQVCARTHNKCAHCRLATAPDELEIVTKWASFGAQVRGAPPVEWLAQEQGGL